MFKSQSGESREHIVVPNEADIVHNIDSMKARIMAIDSAQAQGYIVVVMQKDGYTACEIAGTRQDKSLMIKQLMATIIEHMMIEEAEESETEDED